MTHFDLMKNNTEALNNERVVQIDFIFLSAVLTKEVFCSNSELNIFFYLVTEFITNSVPV